MATLVKDNKIVSIDCNHEQGFSKEIGNLNISFDYDYDIPSNSFDIVLDALQGYEHHPSILKINDHSD